jgi:hypothetical protein
MNLRNLNWTVIYSKEPNIFFGRSGDGWFWDFLFGHNFSFVSELTIHFFKEGISVLSINMNFHIKILTQWFNKKNNWLISLIALDTNYFSFYNNTVLNNMLYWTRINNKEYMLIYNMIIYHNQAVSPFMTCQVCNMSNMTGDTSEAGTRPTRPGISYQLRDIYSTCRSCWNVVTYKWKVHNEKICSFKLFTFFYTCINFWYSTKLVKLYYREHSMLSYWNKGYS